MRRNQYIPRPMDPDVLMIRQACKVVLVQASTAEDRSAEGIAGPPYFLHGRGFQGGHHNALYGYYIHFYMSYAAI